MEIDNLTALEARNGLLVDMTNAKEVAWRNPNLVPYTDAIGSCAFGRSEVYEALTRFKRFSPVIKKLFPETEAMDGIVDSELVDIPKMQQAINGRYYSELEGRLYIKLDSHLPIAGSVKARGGVYEVLKLAEELALKNHILVDKNESYLRLLDEDARELFSQYTIQVGSTGNLGLSIGIMSRALGFKAKIHMSTDAKAWKKSLLREKGAEVIEYDSDYSEAVLSGRELAAKDEFSYFIDDENSKELLLGYAAGGRRMKYQLEMQNITVDDNHPLFVYIPCGVGGAPAGITFGLKQCFGDNVHVFFVEPVQAPCMLLGMVTGLFNNISVQDIGLSGKTEADGLAVSRQSGMAGQFIRPVLSGIFTVDDKKLYQYMKALWDNEKIFIEPSAAAAFHGPAELKRSRYTNAYLRSNNLMDKLPNAVHIVWATGGSLVPDDIRIEYMKEASSRNVVK